MVESSSSSEEVKKEMARMKAIADNDPTNDHLINQTPVVTHPLTYSPNKKGLLIVAGIVGIFIVLFLLIFVGAIALILFSNITQPPVIDSNSLTWEVSGFVVDVDNNPVTDVDILYLFGESSTGDYGTYLIEGNIDSETEFDGNLVLTFNKAGFVPIHKIVHVTNGNYVVDVMMFKEQPFVSVDPSEEIDASMAGASLSSEANSFVVKGTTNSATTANISLTPFDPTKEGSLEAFPGEFSGTRIDGSTTAIETFGFMKVQVKDDSGKALDLAEGKTADITLPISPEQYDSSPTTIPLWYFDPDKGDWIERGTATKVCENGTCIYKGNIDTIASWWNCDQPMNTSYFDCNPANSDNNSGKTAADLMKETATKAAKWALGKMLGKSPAGDIYSAMNLANKIVDEVKGSGSWSDKATGVAKEAVIWAGKKALGKVPGVGQIVSVASLAVDIIQGVRDYAVNKFASMFNVSCEGAGGDYSGKSSSSFSPASRNDYDLEKLGIFRLPADIINTSMPVRADSIVNTKFKAFDSISETVTINSPSGTKTSSMFNQDFSAVTVPIEVNPPEGGGTTYVTATFTNKDGNKTVLTKLLSEKNPIAYLTFYVLSGREGTITINSPFSNYSKEYKVNSLSPGEIFEVEEQQIDIKKVDYNVGGFDSNFSCPAHYAYVKTVQVQENESFTTNGTFDILYYDNVEIDRATSISKIRLFADNIAYEKSKYYYEEDYCGDFYKYDTKAKESCVQKQTRIIYNKQDLGEGRNPEIWANHIAFEKKYSEKGFVYDGKVYGESCMSVSYELWGDNFAYDCNFEKVYWNGKEIGAGRIEGVHKNFLLVQKEDYRHSLYKSGVLVQEEFDSVYGSYNLIGVFGDNWWMTKPESNSKNYGVYLNGNKVFESEDPYPHAVLFENNFAYGNIDELHFNGKTYSNENWYINAVNLFGNNLAFSTSSVLGKVIYNGVEVMGADDHMIKLFGNNWAVTSYNEDPTSGLRWTLTYNGKTIGKAVSSSPILLGNNYSFFRYPEDVEAITDDDYDTTLFFNNVALNVGAGYMGYISLFGNHIAYVLKSGEEDSLFVDSTNLGIYNNYKSPESINKFIVWPLMTADTGIGTRQSNNDVIGNTFDESGESTVFGSSSSLTGKSDSFEDEWLYCTNQWK